MLENNEPYQELRTHAIKFGPGGYGRQHYATWARERLPVIDETLERLAKCKSVERFIELYARVLVTRLETLLDEGEDTLAGELSIEFMEEMCSQAVLFSESDTATSLDSDSEEQ